MRTHRVAIAVVLAVIVGTFALGAKRRAVRSPCAAPKLTLSVSPQVACPTSTVTVSWRASTDKAVVAIDGIGSNLRWVGSSRVFDGRRTFTGYASSSCGRGATATVSVKTPDEPSGSISGPALVRQFNTATLNVSVSGTSSWSLTSSLGNAFTPDSGISSETATYHASNFGTDGILLRITGQCETATERVHSLVVERASQPPPPPPPPTAGIRCCDGTRSPSCTSCSNLRGCCSGHGGVCDCGRQ